MAKRWKLSDEEAEIIRNYREGLETKSEEQKPEETNNDSKEDETMKNGNLKKGLKVAGIGAAVAAVAGGIGYGIYRIFFKDPSGLDDFDDEFEEDDEDLFDEEDQTSGSEDTDTDSE